MQIEPDFTFTDGCYCWGRIYATINSKVSEVLRVNIIKQLFFEKSYRTTANSETSLLVYIVG